MLRIAEETRPRNSSHADFADHPLSRGGVGVEAQAFDVHEDILRTLRFGEFEPGLPQVTQEHIPLGGVGRQQFLVVALRQLQTGNRGLLQRSRCTDR